MALIAPSLLASNFLRLEDECKMLNNSVADWFHLDVMDGRFVPNISFGLPVIEQIRTATTKTLDVHLMIEEPEKYAEAFAKAGANILTVHIEACRNLHRNVQQIKDLGMKAGIALNPHTPISSLVDIIEDIQLVTLMSVNPGFGGQSFIPYTLQKIKQLSQLIAERGIHVDIEIDGGVTLANAKEIIAAGATVLVAGNTVFKSANPIETIAALKGL
jgi:ribulose-phosphate 3-epimerase